MLVLFLFHIKRPPGVALQWTDGVRRQLMGAGLYFGAWALCLSTIPRHEQACFQPSVSKPWARLLALKECSQALALLGPADRSSNFPVEAGTVGAVVRRLKHSPGGRRRQAVVSRRFSKFVHDKVQLLFHEDRLAVPS